MATDDSSKYINEIKKILDENDKKILIDSAIHIKELECERNQLKDKLETKNSRSSCWNTTSYIFTLIIIAGVIIFWLNLHYNLSKKNIMIQQKKHTNTLQQNIKDCNCSKS